VLWLLSLDDQNGTISRAFEVYKGEWPVWYWITFIPQLLMGLQQRESKHARVILMRIAKQFPQSLHFQLRTAKEDMVKRNTTAAAQAAAQAAAAAAAGNKPSNGTVDSSAGNTPDANKDATVKTEQNTSSEAGKTEANQNDANGETAEEKKADVMEMDNPDQAKNEGDTVKSEEQAETENIKEESKSDENATDGSSNGDKPPPVLTGAALNNANKGSPQTPTAATPSHPLDDIMAMLKTGYPLLALSMETMVDQIQLKFKPQADEDMYRLVVALYNEGIQVQYIYTIIFFLFVSLLTFLFFYILATSCTLNESK
jgi:transformation/transcription domain-associated protein